MSVEEDKMIRIVLSSGGTYMSPVTSLKERTLEALRDTFRSYMNLIDDHRGSNILPVLHVMNFQALPG